MDAWIVLFESKLEILENNVKDMLGNLGNEMSQIVTILNDLAAHD